jgi:hypothetical protein
MRKPANDQRAKHRFPIRLPIHFRISGRNLRARWATGTTFDISIGGMSFGCRKRLPVGAHIEMMVEWPATHAGHAIDLQATGFVVRSEGGKAAVRMNSPRLHVHSVGRTASIGALA